MISAEPTVHENATILRARVGLWLLEAATLALLAGLFYFFYASGAFAADFTGASTTASTKSVAHVDAPELH